MVRVPAPHRPSSAAPRLNQEFEGHGLTAQAPCDRGYRLDSGRPASAVGARQPSASDSPGEKKKGKGKPSTIKIHVHVREKVFTVPAGAGTQCIYWLGATGVHRYLSQPHAYSTAFSHEMTAKAVVAEDGAQLHRTARVCDELDDGAHVWVDVGDGAMISHVQSRPFPDRRLFEPGGDDEYQEQIGWEDTEPDKLDDEVIGIDPRLTMQYNRTMLAKQPAFKEWQKLQPASSSSQEGLFDEFTAAWQKVHLDDVPGSTSWMNEVKLALYHHYESIKYVFSLGAAVSPRDGVQYMSLLEFWAFSKRCALTSPWANLAKIDQMFVTKQTEYDPHNPQRTLTLHDFMGAIVRISVLRQKNAMKPEIGLPQSATKLIEDNVLTLTPGFDSFEAHRASSTPFTSAAVRQKLTIHETNLKSLFGKWAVPDETRQTINLSEWLDMYAASGIMAADLTEDSLKEAFIVAELGDHHGVVAQWEEAGEVACCDLIFPEFVEAILRAALLKWAADKVTPIDLKIHEMCLLLIFGPAGVRTSGMADSLLPPLSGVERRAIAAAAVPLAPL